MAEPKKCFQMGAFQGHYSNAQLKVFQMAIEWTPDWRDMRGEKANKLDPSRRLPKNW